LKNANRGSRVVAIAQPPCDPFRELDFNIRSNFSSTWRF
jgi:hypothetical protein